MKLALAIFCATTLAGAPVVVAAPPTPKHPVIDVYHGVSVTDDYRWLEDFSNPAVKQWVAAQNHYTRGILDALPDRARVQSELSTLLERREARYAHIAIAAGKIFALKFQPPRNQPALVMLTSLDQPTGERAIVDPIALDPSGSTEIDFFTPSSDGTLLAVSLSHGGSESGDVHIFDAATGRERKQDIIERVNGGTAGGSVAWSAGNKGFFYTRYPRAGERPPKDMDFYQQVWYHRLGAPPASDTYAVGKDFPRIAEIVLSASGDQRYILASVSNGDGGDHIHYLRGPNGEWKQITHYSDEVAAVAFGAGDALFYLSHHDAAMGKILRAPVAAPDPASARIVVPESDAAIENFVVARNLLYSIDMAGGPSQVRVFSTTGKGERRLPLLPISAVDSPVAIGGSDLLYVNQSYVESPKWFRYSATTGKSTLVESLSVTSKIRFDDAEVKREFATSKDGTKIPLNIVQRRGVALNGANPVLLYGYGGYDISERPRFNPLTRFLLDHGFVYVVANIRGGGEYGEKWHLAGNLTHKQNVFDDFQAAAAWLVAHNYTNPSKLGILGGSNGGLLMGAALTQHPEMYRCVLAFVGIYDMLRVELSPNGAFNVTEFGTVKEMDEFRALYAYSPYHHVAVGVKYPAAIFLTGDNDPRVDPANSRKMVARLQSVGDSKGPILLRTTSHAGHGIGTALNEQVAQYVDAFSFLLNQLGVH